MAYTSNLELTQDGIAASMMIARHDKQHP